MNRRTATCNLFVLSNKETNYNRFFLFQNLSSLLESWPLPTLLNTKKAIWRNLLSIQNEAISLVAMRSKELWLVQENHVTVKLDSNGFSWNENLQQIELRNPQVLKEMLEKSRQFFLIAALWVEKLGLCLEYCRRWKNTFGNFAVNIKGHSIRVLNERSVSDGENMCPPWLVILWSVWHSIGDTL